MHHGCRCPVRPSRRAYGGVLSIAKLGAGAEGYYLDVVAKGAEEYYLGDGEAAGRWLPSAQLLGLSGEVGSEDLRAVLAGMDPAGERLAPMSRRVPGFDLTFSAPKSVSLIHAFGSTSDRAVVVEAHDAAVDAALGYLEREACRLRRGHAGAEVIEASGFIAAAFRHRTSRNGDPQLHTHVLVANLGHGVDGRWSALDARHLYRHGRTAGYLYQAQLRANLSRALGVSWAAPHKGMAEIDSVPKGVLRLFSSRRRAIEVELAHAGTSGYRAAQVATLATRTAKRREDPDGAQQRWAAALREAGVTTDSLAPARSVVARLRAERGIENRTATTRVLLDELTRSDSTFDRQAVVRAWAERALAGADVRDIEAAADGFLRERDVVALSNGRYTTTGQLALEERILDTAGRRKSNGSGVVPEAIVRSVLEAHPELSDEQRRMIERLTAAGHGIDAVIGHPGSGKTHALRATAEAWRAGGFEVVGAALAARAAHQLSEDAGIPSGTVRSMLTSGLTNRVTDRTVIVIDEAGMVGTRDLAQLVSAADRTGAKLVLVGDHAQLPEIDAGGAFRGVAHRVEAVQLSANQRQTLDTERQALGDLRAGRTHLALTRLTEAGHLTLGNDRDGTLDALVARWAELRANGEDVLAMAHRRSDVDELNRRAQYVRAARSELGPQVCRTPAGDLCIGDDVIVTRNDRSVGVLNGTRGRVRGADGEALTIETADGDRRLPIDFATDHVRLGYATTIHKSQGATVDRALLFVTDGVELETAYTAATRGRHENHLFVPHNDVDALAQQLERSGARSLAVEHRALEVDR